MDNNEYEKRRSKRNDLLFFLALITSLGLIVWFTLAFFKTHLDVHDVSAGILSIGLGIIAGYATHSRMLHWKCLGVKRKPGEWIFFLVFMWAGLAWTFYQVKLMSKLFGIDMEVPEHFYSFVGSIVSIFFGSSVWDFLYKNNKRENTSQSEKENVPSDI